TLAISQIHQVLANLLRERVPIRDLEAILEVLGDQAPHTQSVAALTEAARLRLARALCGRYRDADGVLRVVALDPALEERLHEAIVREDRPPHLRLSPSLAEAISEDLSAAVERLAALGSPPVVVCGSAIRPGLKQMTRAALPRLIVLSDEEITRDTELEVVAQIGMPTNDEDRTEGERFAASGVAVQSPHA
ncbi:MAG: FHIPEP family type III secretion protein, partial [Planctomycetaceae bacterium]